MHVSAIDQNQFETIADTFWITSVLHTSASTREWLHNYSQKHLLMFLYLLPETFCYKHLLRVYKLLMKWRWRSTSGWTTWGHSELNGIHLFGLDSGNSVGSRIRSSCLSSPTVCFWPPQKFRSDPSPLDSKVSCRAWCPAAATSWPRCIYRWLYQLIAGLQHVASKLRRKRQQRSCGIFCLICSQNAAAPPALTSGPPGFTLVILDFKTILLCLAADTLDFNYSNAAFHFSNELITLPCSISLH